MVMGVKDLVVVELGIVDKVVMVLGSVVMSVVMVTKMVTVASSPNHTASTLPSSTPPVTPYC